MYKKIFTALILILCIFVFTTDSYSASSRIYIRNVFTGGGIGALDSLDGTLPSPTRHNDPLNDGDMAIVITRQNDSSYPFKGEEFTLDADSGIAESTPWTTNNVIAPDTNPGTKRWIKTNRIGEINLCLSATPSSGNFLLYDSVNSCWDIVDHTGNTDAHHAQSHTIASHNDTTGTGAELNNLTDGTNADSLHDHTNASVIVTHVSTTGQTTSDHHVKTVSSDIDHDSITGVSSDDHHNEIHNLGTHSDDGDVYSTSDYGLISNGDQYRWMGVLPLNYDWSASSYTAPNDVLQEPVQPYILKVGGIYFYYSEEFDDSGDDSDNTWEIDLCTTTTPEVQGSWACIDRIVGKGGAGEYDEVGTADPTVLYIPWSDTPYHMWFDMLNGATEWRIGHAVSTDGITWTKQNFDSANGTDAVVHIADIAKFDGWNAGLYGHAPEVYMCGGSVYMINNVKDVATVQHNGYDAMLYIASDPFGMGYEFIPFGPVTLDTTTWENDADRLKSIFVHDGIVYASIWDELEDAAGTTKVAFISSNDCGKSWKQLGIADDDSASPDDFGTILVDGTKIIGFGEGSSPTVIEIDLTNLSGSVATPAVGNSFYTCGYENDPFETVTNQCQNNPLQVVENVAYGYYINGNAVADASNLYINNTSVMTPTTIQPEIINSGLESLSLAYWMNNQPTVILNGTTQTMSITDGAATTHLEPAAGQDIIVEFLFKTTDTTAGFVGKSTGAVDVATEWGLYAAGGTITWKLRNDSAAFCNLNRAGFTTYEDGEWHHLMAVADVSGCSGKFYIDGVSLGSVGNSTDISGDGITGNGMDFKIGAGDSRILVGEIANFRMYLGVDYSSHLSDATAALYNFHYPKGIHSTIVADLVAEYWIDEGEPDGGTIADTGPTAQAATVNNAPTWSRRGL